MVEPAHAHLAASISTAVGDRWIGCAESFTGGLIAQALSAAPSSGDWFRGGVVAYHRSVKHGVLGVPEGPVVTVESAEAMAKGAAEVLDVDVALATTGAAGPDGQDGAPPGTVILAVRTPAGCEVEVLELAGEPEEVCVRATTEALTRLLAALRT
jgi:nicotinamide-nucleotide amidase